MTVNRRELLKRTGLAAAATSLGASPVRANGIPVIQRDVCIIGGGSAGTYTAIRLRDLGRSVVVLERQSRLGGHVDTFVDPTTGTAIDIGARDFEGTPLVRQYFARLNVTAAPVSQGDLLGPSAYIDFRTGLPVAGYAPPGSQAAGAALFAYQQILATQFPYLDSGFTLPTPVPADLLAPFGEFVAKYGLQAAVPTIFAIGEGVGDLLRTPALYVLKIVSRSFITALLTGNLLYVPAGAQTIYDKALGVLGSDALLGATVAAVFRNGSTIYVLAETAQGPVLVQSGKLVIACPPTLDNLWFLDLDDQETALFARWRTTCYATSLVQVSGLPPGTTIVNTAPETAYNLPPLPCTYLFNVSPIAGSYNALFGSVSPAPEPVIRKSIETSVAKLAQSGTFPNARFQGFQLFRNHTPYQITVSAHDVAAGFYTSLNALQGHRSTYFTGAAWQANDSSLVWSFTEALLPKIAAA